MTLQAPAKPPASSPRRIRDYWRRRLRPAWRAAQPWVLIGGAALVVILGTIGYHEVDRGRLPSYSFTDSLYRAIALFGFAGSVEAKVPPELEVARILAPAIVGYAAIRGLIVVFRDQAQLLFIRLFRRRHVVVVGLGETGFRIVTAFNETHPVVGLERDPANPAIGGCRDRGISILKGDGTDPAVLQKARLDRADYMFVACGDDRVDMDVLAASRSVARRRRGDVLTAFVSLEDPLLWRTLAARVLATPHRHPGMRREFFSLSDLGAELLIEHHPPFDVHSQAEPRLLMIGVGAVGESVLLKAARRWQVHRPAEARTMHVTLAGPGAEIAAERMRARYPHLTNVCELEPVELALDSAQLLEGAFLRSHEKPPLTAAYICLDDETTAARTALSLGPRPQMSDVAIVVAVQDAEAGVSTALGDGPSNVRAFGVVSSALTPQRLLEGVNETLARAMHDAYVRFEQAKGLTARDNELLVPWDDLSSGAVGVVKAEDAKAASRAFVDGIGAKLEKTGCSVVSTPLIDPAGALLEFSDAEVESLAIDEHDRWCEQRWSQGWSVGPGKDASLRTHPSLVPWAELPEDERQKDRDLVRTIPVRLAQAEFELLRSRDDRVNEAGRLAATADAGEPVGGRAG